MIHLADNFNCEAGWIKHGTHCFKVFEQKTTHKNANDICRKNQATLAVPHEDRCIQFLSRIVYLKNIPDMG